MSGAEHDPLARLAAAHGVLSVFRDGFHRRRQASPSTLTAVLRELGADLERPSDAPQALRRVRLERWSRLAPPSKAVFSGEPATLDVRLAAGELDDRPLGFELFQENGETRRWTMPAAAARAVRSARVEGSARVALKIALPDDLPLGRHRLVVERGAARSETHLIVTPPRCFEPPSEQRFWGVFLPLYSLHSASSWGAGDFSDLAECMDWTRGLGGALVGSLPLLAAYLDEPYEYSPYVPVSRLFWNEFYLDPRREPEWERCPEARQAIAGASGVIADLRQASLADYREQMALKRRALEPMSRAIERDAGRFAEFERYVEERPELQDYASFRAATERAGAKWREWPKAQRDRAPRAGADYDPEARRYHLYVQWLIDRRLAELAERAGSPGLYLDLPLGVHPGGYDVWKRPASFALEVAGGAPPDRFFTRGQNWGFAPLHPGELSRDGLHHWFECLRSHLRHAGVLRLDHFMALHRLYWIPRGASAEEGTYVRYPAEEMYAAVCLESQRRRALIVGEDLGTVPAAVRARMAERGIDRMYVAQFSLGDDPARAMEEPPAASMAGLDTHDTPTFAAYWRGLDIDLRLEMGLLSDGEAVELRERREAIKDAAARFLGARNDSQAVFEACLKRLARSPARSVMINIEDLWGETEPQNTPGTGQERPNWRRKARRGLEQIRSDGEIATLLRAVRDLRAGDC